MCYACAQEMEELFEDIKAKPLRFEEGEQVMCLMPESAPGSKFVKGTILEQWVDGAPYLISIDGPEGIEILVPEDTNKYVCEVQV